MRIPIIDKNKTVITTLDVKECDDVGVIHMGSGLARRTFRYNGKVTLPSRPDDGAAFEEVATKTILDPTAQLSVDPELGNMLTVMLSEGQRVCIKTQDSDGKFIISFDYKGSQKLFVWSDLPGNVCGDDGIIYMEDFAKVDPRLAGKVEVLLEQPASRGDYPGEQISSHGGMFGNRTGEE